MKPTVTRDIVLHTAELARLDVGRLSDDEIELLRSQLDAIVRHAAELDELDLSDIEPTTHAVPTPMRMRDDRPGEGPSRDAILANAPQAEDGFFVVPRIIAE
jgi:aspartyl-tRNA(Asn)/glutamyl-tRNA(Gln) amidotransferase subunit C